MDAGWRRDLPGRLRTLAHTGNISRRGARVGREFAELRHRHKCLPEPFARYAEGYTRAAVHPETTSAAYNYDPTRGHSNLGANVTRDAHGSWFDAGDTHVDVVNTAVACWFLLETMRDFGRIVAPYSLDLPESNSQRSDLVPLIKNALDWLQRMQNADGSVCHYVLGNPNTVAQPQQVSDVSSFGSSEKCLPRRSC